MSTPKNSKASSEKDSKKATTTNEKKSSGKLKQTDDKATKSVKKEKEADGVDGTNNSKKKDMGIKELVNKVLGKSDTKPENKTKPSTDKAKVEVEEEKPKHDFERIFEIKGKASFLDECLNVGWDGATTSITRTEAILYKINGILTDGVTPFEMFYDCELDEDGDILWSELLQYVEDQKNPTLIAERAKTLAESGRPPVEYTTAVKPEHIDVKKILTDRMTSYGQSIGQAIKTSHKCVRWGYLPASEVNALLASSSKDFTYAIETDANGTFINVSQGATVVKTEYLPIR